MHPYLVDLSWTFLWRKVNRPIVWGGVYVASIFLWAFIYQDLKYPFVHTTARFEVETRRAPRDLADSLQAEIIRVSRFWNRSGKLRRGGWDIDVQNIIVSSVRPARDDERLKNEISADYPRARLVVTASALDTTGFVLAQCSAELQLVMAGPPLPDNFDELPDWQIASSIPPQFGIRQTASPILAARADSIRRSVDTEAFSSSVIAAILDSQPYGASIALSGPLVNRVRYFIDAENGFPQKMPGGFGRMLYVSAVTITTLGYGDIVPISGPARLWTALEAVWGILVAGVFVNSVASGLTKSS